MSEHAIYSPSSCYRNMHCHGAVAMNKRAMARGIKPVTSKFAAEGTQAHTWIEKCYSNNDELENITDTEMRDHVRNYLLFLKGLRVNFEYNFEISDTFIEKRVKYDGDFWGTVDFAMIGTHKKTGQVEAIICDFKYGRGVEVEAEDNEQVLCYAICLEKTLGISLNKIHAFIYQPRTPGKEFSRWTIDRDKLITEAAFILANKDTVTKIKFESVEAEVNTTPGEWCRFCTAKPICKNYLLDLNSTALKVIDNMPEVTPTVPSLTLQQKLEVFKRRKILKKFIDDVCADLLQLAAQGMEIPNHKVVKGVQRRMWDGDIAAIGVALTNLGVENPYKLSLVGIGEVEKQIGKGKIESLTKLSEPTYQLVPDDDKRQAVINLGLLELDEINFTE